jgi:PhzF family phenazine biosynthesis protein
MGGTILLNNQGGPLMQRPFKQVDVFTSVPLKGNPLAVVLDGTGLTDAEMQQFANWTNLSETTFIMPATDPGADYHLRIFTPTTELPFAGHPTLGSAHAALEAGIATPKNGKLTMQCGVGLVDIAVPNHWRADGLSFRLPDHKMWAAKDPATLLDAMHAQGQLKVDPSVVDVGPHWVIAEFANATDVSAFKPNLPALADYDRANGTTGLTIFAETGDGRGGIIVRSFAPLDGIAEDPVCGSGNGSVAAYRLETGSVTRGQSYVASQGREIGRDGYIHVRLSDDGIHIGGNSVTCVDGVVTI